MGKSSSNTEDFDLLLVQDRLTAPGGGERVAFHIANNFDCDIITGAFDSESTYDFDPDNITELGGNTFIEFIKARVSIEWEEYDAVIFSGNRPQFTLWKPIDIPTIRYCHSPTRIFWALRDVSYRESSLIGKVARHAIGPTYRTLDRRLAARHDLILTNSHNIRSQVDRFYGLDADVLYPPVNVDKYRFERSGDFWLSVNRLVPKKRVREQIAAFEGTDQKLRIVGGIDDQFREYGESIMERAKASKNIQIEGFLSDEKLRELFAHCRGVIYLPFFEDFGIVPIEAMASGKPVVVAAEGGPIETVTHQQTGWLIKPSIDNIQKVITSRFDPDKFRQHALSSVSRYDLSKFTNKIEDFIINAIDNYE